MADASLVGNVGKLSKAKGKEEEPSHSLEQLFGLVNTERLDSIRNESAKELAELVKRQEQVRKLHELVADLNNRTDSDGKLKIEKDSSLENKLKEAEKMGVRLKKTHGTFEGIDRQHLHDNIKSAIDGLNMENEMQIMKVDRLTKENYESYQLARMGEKSLHEAKKAIATNIAR